MPVSPAEVAIEGDRDILQAHSRIYHRITCRTERASEVQKAGPQALTPKPKLSSAAGKKDKQARSTGVSGWMSSAALARLKTAPDASLEAAVARLGMALPDQGGGLLPASGEAAQQRRAEVAAAALSSPTIRPAVGVRHVFCCFWLAGLSSHLEFFPAVAEAVMPAQAAADIRSRIR